MINPTVTNVTMLVPLLIVRRNILRNLRLCSTSCVPDLAERECYQSRYKGEMNIALPLLLLLTQRIPAERFRGELAHVARPVNYVQIDVHVWLRRKQICHSEQAAIDCRGVIYLEGMCN